MCIEQREYHVCIGTYFCFSTAQKHSSKSPIWKFRSTVQEYNITVPVSGFLKGKPETREDTKKFYDHLFRQGFGYDLIRERMASVTSREFDSDGE